MRGYVYLKAVNYFILLITLRPTLRASIFESFEFSYGRMFFSRTTSYAPVAITYNML